MLFAKLLMHAECTSKIAVQPYPCHAGVALSIFMKRDVDGEGKRVVWDEGNLTANEELKNLLNTTKITEPKTPYVHGIEPDATDPGNSVCSGASSVWRVLMQSSRSATDWATVRHPAATSVPAHGCCMCCFDCTACNAPQRERNHHTAPRMAWQCLSGGSGFLAIGLLPWAEVCCLALG
jgi:hypothetical protein